MGRLSVWFPKQRSTKPRMMPTETVSRPRMVLKTTVILSRDPSVEMKLHRRWIPLTRPLWKARSKKRSAGWTATLRLKRRSTKRSKRNLKVLQCQSFKRWVVLLEPEVCQELLREAPLLLLNQQEDLPSKKLTKTV